MARRLLFLTVIRCSDTQLIETAIEIATLLAAVLVHVERRECVRGPPGSRRASSPLDGMRPASSRSGRDPYRWGMPNPARSGHGRSRVEVGINWRRGASASHRSRYPAKAIRLRGWEPGGRRGDVRARGFERVGLAALLVSDSRACPDGVAISGRLDEPQHLHVVWAWTHGLLPYRDVFDNHMPLFHLLSAPVLLAVGERPTAILWMRFLMLPQWCAALFLTALIGRRLFAPQVGAWSTVLAGFYPLFFFCSLDTAPMSCGRCSGSPRS